MYSLLLLPLLAAHNRIAVKYYTTSAFEHGQALIYLFIFRVLLELFLSVYLSINDLFKYLIFIFALGLLPYAFK